MDVNIKERKKERKKERNKERFETKIDLKFEHFQMLDDCRQSLACSEV